MNTEYTTCSIIVFIMSVILQTICMLMLSMFSIPQEKEEILPYALAKKCARSITRQVLRNTKECINCLCGVQL